MAIAANHTQSIIQRGGLLPLLRYGNYAGPGYAGGMGAETVIAHPDINGGEPIAAGVLAQSPAGLASFMKLALQTEPNGYIDSVTRLHDVEYTVAEIRFMRSVQSQFDGRLPQDLTGQDRLEPAYRQLAAACDAEYWQADQRMLGAIADYHPIDFADATYRDLMLKAFCAKAESRIFGYGLGQQVIDFYNALRARDPAISMPSFWDSWGTLARATTMARADLEALVTLPITPQERQFFNQHLRCGQYIDATIEDDDGNFPGAELTDYRNRIVVPSSADGVVYSAWVRIGRDNVGMTLDKSDPRRPVFTKVTVYQGERLSMQTITPLDDGPAQAAYGLRAYQEVTVSRNGQSVQTRIIPRPEVPALSTPGDLQVKIDAVLTGDYGRVLQARDAAIDTGLADRAVTASDGFAGKASAPNPLV